MHLRLILLLLLPCFLVVDAGQPTVFTAVPSSQNTGVTPTVTTTINYPTNLAAADSIIITASQDNIFKAFVLANFPIKKPDGTNVDAGLTCTAGAAAVGKAEIKVTVAAAGALLYSFTLPADCMGANPVGGTSVTLRGSTNKDNTPLDATPYVIIGPQPTTFTVKPSTLAAGETPSIPTTLQFPTITAANDVITIDSDKDNIFTTFAQANFPLTNQATGAQVAASLTCTAGAAGVGKAEIKLTAITAGATLYTFTLPTGCLAVNPVKGTAVIMTAKTTRDNTFLAATAYTTIGSTLTFIPSTTVTTVAPTVKGTISVPNALGVGDKITLAFTTTPAVGTAITSNYLGSITLETPAAAPVAANNVPATIQCIASPLPGTIVITLQAAMALDPTVYGYTIPSGCMGPNPAVATVIAPTFTTSKNAVATAANAPVSYTIANGASIFTAVPDTLVTGVKPTKIATTFQLTNGLIAPGTIKINTLPATSNVFDNTFAGATVTVTSADGTKIDARGTVASAQTFTLTFPAGSLPAANKLFSFDIPTGALLVNPAPGTITATLEPTVNLPANAADGLKTTYKIVDTSLKAFTVTPTTVFTALNPGPVAIAFTTNKAINTQNLVISSIPASTIFAPIATGAAAPTVTITPVAGGTPIVAKAATDPVAGTLKLLIPAAPNGLAANTGYVASLPANFFQNNGNVGDIVNLRIAGETVDTEPLAATPYTVAGPSPSPRAPSPPAPQPPAKQNNDGLLGLIALVALPVIAIAGILGALWYMSASTAVSTAPAAAQPFVAEPFVPQQYLPPQAYMQGYGNPQTPQYPVRYM